MHGVEAHLHGPLRTLVVKGRRNVPCELAEQVTEAGWRSAGQPVARAPAVSPVTPSTAAAVAEQWLVGRHDDTSLNAKMSSQLFWIIRPPTQQWNMTSVFLFRQQNWVAVKIEQPTDKLFQGVSEALRSLPGIEAIIASLAWTHEMTLTAVASCRIANCMGTV